ncbi:VOC family protein [Jeotgalibacillus campisalis]|uniref:Glyoxalase n=1 Tax=Jeotgalibacillus campisalis TaxID=220754 RepID=A0A0C2R875_9BACL|nr:VOC family protein [Jeotgalibacillus campisalis]KIL46420.1 glyoxalase [Jeotgalibacillus campisalis]
MPVYPYLVFNGNCLEAVQFYAEVFDAELQPMMRFNDMPENPEYKIPEEAKEFIMHTQLGINGTNVMFSDQMPGMPYTQGNSISLAFVQSNENEIRTYFSRLKETGQVNMELRSSSWSRLYGQVTDRFGVIWQFNQDE